MPNSPKTRANQLRNRDFKNTPPLSRHLVDSLRKILATNDLDRIPIQLCEILQAQHVVILLQKGSDLVVRAEHSVDKSNREVFISKTIVWSVFQTGEPFLSLNALTDSRINTTNSVIELSLRDVVAVPLISDAETIGVLYAATFGEMSSPYFTVDNLSIIQAVGNLIGVVFSKTTPTTGVVVTAPEVFRHGIGNYLRQVRENRSLGLRAVADETGINYVWISRAETGKIDNFEKYVTNLTTLARFYNVPEELILTLANVELTDLPADIPSEQKTWLREILADPEVIDLLHIFWGFPPHQRHDLIRLAKNNVTWYKTSLLKS